MSLQIKTLMAKQLQNYILQIMKNKLIRPGHEALKLSKDMTSCNNLLDF